jgi:hypothetical protein
MILDRGCYKDNLMACDGHSAAIITARDRGPNIAVLSVMDRNTQVSNRMLCSISSYLATIIMLDGVSYLTYNGVT